MNALNHQPDSRKIVIVGGVAGGASAAARLRRLDENAHIVMFERGPHISFANCGLPYYIGGEIKDRSRLFVQTPEAMTARFGLDIRTESEVVALNPNRKTVTVRSRERGDYEESYDAVILAPGAKPLLPPLPGLDSPRVLTLRNIADTDRIREQATAQGARSAIVVGGGFIGVEMAENLQLLGLDVTLIEAGRQLLAPFDPEMAAMLAQELESRGVHILLGDSLAEARELENGGMSVSLAGGRSLSADLLIAAIGVKPDTDFLRSSGLKLGPRGHIEVNAYMETSLEGVYAAGDAVMTQDFILGGPTAVPLAGPANKQGRIAADNVSGLRTEYKGTQGTAIVKVFGLTGAATGRNEASLKRDGIPYQVIHVHPNSHASYYPGAMPLVLKLLFAADGRILGAQAVGADGADKRIDVIATLIRMNGTTEDLTELELAYAPPYSSAKDPVNMLGYAAENVRTGMVRVYTADELENRDPETTMLVDVRTELEFANGHIDGAVHLPVDELRGSLDRLDPSKEIWVYCQVGLRGYTASRILTQRGYRVRNLSGGYKTWLMSGYRPKDDQPGQSANPANGRTETLPSPAANTAEEELDACGLCCPGPLIRLKQSVDGMADGASLRITATDPGFYEDVQAWTTMTGNTLTGLHRRPDGIIEAVIRKTAGGGSSASAKDGQRESSFAPLPPSADPASTMVVFSGDLDKAIASFIIANGAAASGRKVTMFFTFWGLNVLRKPERQKIRKSFMGRMFGMMMPRGSRKLALSRMNMLGAGPVMIRSLMKSKNVESLESLMKTAIGQGVELVACQMSMDLMGIAREELIDEVGVGGVGHYLGRADRANHNLFI
ncbi:FAD-dependent oxidoreductase [Paenibacillus spiritus]|uniref:FAD-dependent oxidoreductase n=1 Tax=Paenibacillus spiritus TaxID=2496557 RepID=UPI001CC43AF1|nr:FAD-dependent oxidoreductase [Paenibacillus spiritus]